MDIQPSDIMKIEMAEKKKAERALHENMRDILQSTGKKDEGIWVYSSFSFVIEILRQK